LQLHGLPLDRTVPKNHDIMANHSSATIREVTPVNKTESRWSKKQLLTPANLLKIKWYGDSYLDITIRVMRG